MALVNQQAVAAGKPAVGFINPIIYELANESIYNSAFHDTTTGNNTSSASPNAFYAGPGYDLCTGIGTPNGTNLINALINPDPLIVISNYGFNAIGSAAGTFDVTSQTFYLTNAGAATLEWSLINTSAWLDVSMSSGTLAVGASNSVVVSLNTVATNLNAGTYTANLWFSNVTSGVAHARQFSLKISDALVILPMNYFSFIGPSGGPFAPASQEIILTNARSGILNWGINNTSAWFNVSPASGSLSSGAQANVTFTLTPAVTNLANGIYTATFQVTNLASQFVQVITGSVLVGQPLVQNGGFETGDFTGWTLNGDAGNFNYVDDGSTVTSIAPHTGTYFAALGESGFLAYLSQTLSTTVGQKYLISLWLNNPFAGNSHNPIEFSVAWNGSTLYDKKNFAQTSWTNMQFVVKATGSSTVLQIGGQDDNYYLGLDDVTVTPGFAPAISTQPNNLTILSGSNAVFSATVSGTAPLVYQWRKNGTNLSNGGNISGATSNVLTLTAVTTNSSGNYNLSVTNIFGVSTSSVAKLTVLLPPTITGSLTNRTIECGSNVTYTVTAAGTPPLNYQWSLDGTPVSGATNTSLSLTNVHLPNHTVTLVVTNLYASLTSNAVLTVHDTIAPVITLNGSNPIYVELGGAFSDPGATATDVCAGAVGVIVSGSVNTNSVGTNTLVYTAADGNGNTNTAARTVIVRGPTPPATLWSFTNLVLAADTNCSAAMPDVTGTNFILATDLSGALTISQSPTNNAILLPGTNLVVITVKDASSNAAYSTNFIVVQDQTPPVITLNGSSSIFSELGQAFVDPGATANDACAGVVAVTVSGSVNTNAVGTNTLTYTASDGSGNTNTAIRTVIVRDTTPPTILWSFSNLVLVADTNCSAAMPDVIGTNFILATDLSGVLVISQTPTNGAVLLIGTNMVVVAVSDIFSNTAYSTNTIVVQDQTPPVISSQPQNRTNLVGTTANFSTAATACTPLAYQWFFNSTVLASHTNSTLTLVSVSLTNAGNYSV